MSLDEINIEGSARSPSQMCFSGDDYDRMDLELVSCDARIVVGKVDSNVWCEMRFESDEEFIEECSNEKYLSLH